MTPKHPRDRRRGRRAGPRQQTVPRRRPDMA